MEIAGRIAGGLRCVEQSYDEKIDWIRLARSENVGPISFFHLLRRYGSAREALDRLPSVARRSRGSLRIPSISDAEREYEAHASKGFKIISYVDTEYPDALRNIPDSPPIISVRGRTELFSGACVAIVGSRGASCAGKQMADMLARRLSAKKFVIVSGLARGIDMCAHKGSVDYGTVAVLAGGVDVVYPPENRDLYNEIAEKGAVISEAPIGTQVSATLFPRRNRIISGISWGVVVVEAGLKSGSLITVKYALEQGRQVFAVPGHPLDARSRGVNSLIKDGAKVVEDVSDIIEEYKELFGYKGGFSLAEDSEEFGVFSEDSADMRARICGCRENPQQMLPLKDDSDEIAMACEALLKEISSVSIPFSDLLHVVRMSPSVLQAALVELEIDGLIVREPGGFIALNTAGS